LCISYFRFWTVLVGGIGVEDHVKYACPRGTSASIALRKRMNS
jgi:hypothetical protein